MKALPFSRPSRLLIVLLLAFAACWVVPRGNAANAADGKKLRVVTTFSPITSLTRNVAGETATVEQLLPPGAEAHHFALRPSHLKKLAVADVLVENGLGMEEWVDEALKSTKARRVNSSKGISPVDGNPHIWLDPVLAARQVENIAKGLAEADPANASAYQQNAAAYIARLKTLDAEIRSGLGSLKERRLLTSHGAFDYFASRYDFRVVGVFERFPGREPTPKALLALRDTIRQNDVKVIFTEPGKPRRVLLSLSKELGLPVVEIDPMESGKGAADDYEKITRKNLRNFKEALGAVR